MVVGVQVVPALRREQSGCGHCGGESGELEELLDDSRCVCVCVWGGREGMSILDSILILVTYSNK